MKPQKLALVFILSFLALLFGKRVEAEVLLIERGNAIYELSCDKNPFSTTFWVKVYPDSGTITRATGEVTFGARYVPVGSPSVGFDQSIAPDETAAVGALMPAGFAASVASASGSFFGTTADGEPIVYRIPVEEIWCTGLPNQAL